MDWVCNISAPLLSFLSKGGVGYFLSKTQIHQRDGGGGYHSRQDMQPVPSWLTHEGNMEGHEEGQTEAGKHDALI